MPRSVIFGVSWDTEQLRAVPSTTPQAEDTKFRTWEFSWTLPLADVGLSSFLDTNYNLDSLP